MLSAEVEKVLSAVFKEARARRLEFVNIDYLLLHLLRETTVNAHLERHGADVEAIERQLRHFVYQTLPVIEEEGHETESAPSFQRVLDRAVFIAESWRHPLVAGLHVLDAILAEQETEAATILGRHGIVPESVARSIEAADIFRDAPVREPAVAVATPEAPAERAAADPFSLDQQVRATVRACWHSLPQRRRTPDALEAEVLRLTRRALRDFREDFDHEQDGDADPD